MASSEHDETRRQSFPEKAHPIAEEIFVLQFWKPRCDDETVPDKQIFKWKGTIKFAKTNKWGLGISHQVEILTAPEPS